jgi:transcription elongation factor GreA
MNEAIYLTQEGKQNLQKELEHLKGPKRKAIALRLKHAIEMGDLSENADYKSAKEDQGFLEGRILEIESILRNAQVVEKNGDNPGEINIGSKVTVQEGSYPVEIYHLVGVKEADASSGKISYESPIGNALIGHRKGESVTVRTPNGEITLQILDVD